jgi:hypothetical protein
MRLLPIIVSLGLAGACGSRLVESTMGAVVGESSGRTAIRAVEMRGDVVAVYAATFTASAACAFVLEPEARKRTYTATLRSEGSIEWSGPTLNPPSGHDTISSGVLSNNSLLFSIDVERDSESHGVHGLWDWDDFGGGKFLNISGKGLGVAHGTQVTGAFDGLFELHDPFGHYCQATNHQFRFVKQ